MPVLLKRIAFTSRPARPSVTTSMFGAHGSNHIWFDCIALILDHDVAHDIVLFSGTLLRIHPAALSGSTAPFLTTPLAARFGSTPYHVSFSTSPLSTVRAA